MRKAASIILLSVLFCSIISFSQNQKIDSLRSLIKISGESLSKVDNLIDLSWDYQEIPADTSEAMKTACDGLILAKKLNYKKGIGDSYQCIGSIYDAEKKYDEAIEFYKKALEIRKSLNDNQSAASSYNNIAIAYKGQSQFQLAILYFHLSSISYQIAGNELRSILALNAIGNIYLDNRIYPQAFEYYKQALKINESSGNKKGIAESFNNIGILFLDQNDYRKAIEYFNKSLLISKSISDKNGIATCFNNMATAYLRIFEIDSAMVYYNYSLKTYNELKDSDNVANCMTNIGTAFQDNGDYKHALDYYFNSLKIFRSVQDDPGVSDCLSNIGGVYLSVNNYTEAHKYYDQSLEMEMKMKKNINISNRLMSKGIVYFHENNFTDALKYFARSLDLSLKNKSEKVSIVDYQYTDLRTNYEWMVKTFFKLNNFSKAFEYESDLVQVNDSIYRSEKSLMRSVMKFEYEQKQSALNMIQEQKDAVQKAEFKRQSYILYSFIIGFILIFVFAFYIYRNYKIKQKDNLLLAKQKAEITIQKDEIELQRNVIEEKNKNITDSIRYAYRIQQAILPTDEFISKLFPESFVIFRPKDIVSGDFYWFDESKNKLLFSAVDCTGHGVPGAFMSIVASNLLDQALNEHHFSRPSDILDYLNIGLNSTFRQSHDESKVNDGMDIALCAIDRDSLILEYAGAYNPVYIVRNNELIEIKADKIAIGSIKDNEKLIYTNNEFQLIKGDMMYVFSDGFEDQFGEETNKKFMARRMKEMLINVQNFNMNLQKGEILKVFEKWKGTLEQIDDVLLIGVKVT